MYKGRTKEQKRAILDIVHQSLVEVFKIPEDDRNQRVYEFEEENFERRSNKSVDFLIIEITAFKGRTKETKAKLYKTIVDSLCSKTNIASTDIVIYINEPPLENWGIFGGKSADEVDLGFSVEV
jgi:4-oxalocrotonate tautomerase family enzyme